MIRHAAIGGASLYTALIPGRDVYETITAFEGNNDGDPATGPDTGELRPTADNGSAVDVLAISEFDARLDLDLDGDGSTDHSIIVPWLEFQP
jgi:hypothetical protein